MPIRIPLTLRSCGVFAYILLAGYPPFWGEMDELLDRIKTGEYSMEYEGWELVSEDAKDSMRAANMTAA